MKERTRLHPQDFYWAICVALVLGAAMVIGPCGSYANAQVTASGRLSLVEQLRSEWRLPQSGHTNEQWSLHVALCDAAAAMQRDTSAGLHSQGHNIEEWKQIERKYVVEALEKNGVSWPGQKVQPTATQLPPWASNRSDNVLRIEHREGNGSSWGSGTYLGAGLVLTAAHVVDSDGSRVVGHFRDGLQVEGQTVGFDGTWDTAVVQLDSPHPKLTGVPLAKGNVQAGARVYATGYDGGREQLLWRPGSVTGYGMPEPFGQPADWFSLSNAVSSGCSGGGVFDDSGCLVGNLWGAGQRGTTVVSLGRTRRFLLPWNAKLEAFRLALATGYTPAQACSGGFCPAPNGGGYAGGGRDVFQGGTPTEPPQEQPSALAPPLLPVAPSPPVGPLAPAVTSADEIAAKVISHIEANAEKFRGAAGPGGPQGVPGPAGEAGPAGQPGKDGVCNADAITEKLLAHIAANPDRFRGPRGERGERGDNGNNGKDAVLSEEFLQKVADSVGARIVAKVEPVGRSK